MTAKQAANKAIIELIQSKEFKKCIDKIEPQHLQEDLASEVYLALLETNPEKIVQLRQRNELKFYAVRIITNMACSNTSSFYKKFRSTVLAEYKDNLNSDTEDSSREINVLGLLEESTADRKKLELLVYDIIYNDDRHYNTREEYSPLKLYWYDAEILQAYIKHKDYRAVSKATNIPFTSIYLTVKNALQDLRRIINKSEIPTDKEISQIIEVLNKSKNVFKVA